MDIKICKKCQASKPITEFFSASKYKGKQYYRGECKECTRKELSSESGLEAQRRYRNSEKGKAKKSQYKKDPNYRKRQTEYSINKYRTDPLYKCKKNLRRRLKACLYRENWTKKFTFAQYIGCTHDELMRHLESKFTEGMDWKVFLTTDKIHIDHIIPLSSATSEEEVYKLCHYTNLQPLWALDNIKKSNKLP